MPTTEFDRDDAITSDAQKPLWRNDFPLYHINLADGSRHHGQRRIVSTRTARRGRVMGAAEHARHRTVAVEFAGGCQSGHFIRVECRGGRHEIAAPDPAGRAVTNFEMIGYVAIDAETRAAMIDDPLTVLGVARQDHDVAKIAQRTTRRHFREHVDRIAGTARSCMTQRGVGAHSRDRQRENRFRQAAAPALLGPMR